MNTITADPITAITSDSPSPIGEEPTAEEIEQVEWARESIRNAAGALIDSHKQLLTLNSVLLAGSAAFLSQSTMPRWIKAMAATCFLVSLGCSLWGSLPREVQLCPYAPYEIKRSREKGAASRFWWLKMGAVAFFFGLIALGVGLVF